MSSARNPSGMIQSCDSCSAHERVIATPHLGASTVEAQVRVATEVARNIIAALRGDTLYGVATLSFPPQSLHNREQKETPYLQTLIDENT